MGINLGLDIGAISIKLAALGGEEDRAALAGLCAAMPAFRPADCGGRPMVLSAYQRITGSPIQSAYDLLREFYEGVSEERIEGIRVTGSGSRRIAQILGLFYENEFKADRGDDGRVPSRGADGVRAGRGEREVPAARRAPSIVDYDRAASAPPAPGRSSTSRPRGCATRWKRWATVVRTAASAAQIAGRCSVFASSDMIHAQQKGYTPGGDPARPVRRGGAQLQEQRRQGAQGRAAGRADRRRFAERRRRATRCATRSARRRRSSCRSTTPGAARSARRCSRPRSRGSGPRATSTGCDQHAGMEQAALATPAAARWTTSCSCATGWRRTCRRAGAARSRPTSASTSGSSRRTSSVTDESGALDPRDLPAHARADRCEAVQQGLTGAGGAVGRRGSTIRGRGHDGIGPRADRRVRRRRRGATTRSPPTRPAAARHARRWAIAPVDTIFEIGGQDSKFIATRERRGGGLRDERGVRRRAPGRSSRSRRRSSGSASRTSSPGSRSRRPRRPASASGARCSWSGTSPGGSTRASRCRTSWRACAYSIALNYLNRVVRGRQIGDVIYFQGGTAYNDAVAAAFAGLLGKRIIVPPHNGVIGRDRHGADRPGVAPGDGGGHDASAASTCRSVGFTTRDFVCKGCANQCDMKEFVIEGQRSYWGDKCSDKYRKPAATGREAGDRRPGGAAGEPGGGHGRRPSRPRRTGAAPGGSAIGMSRDDADARSATRSGTATWWSSASSRCSRRRPIRRSRRPASSWRSRSRATRSRWRTGTCSRCSSAGVDYVLRAERRGQRSPSPARAWSRTTAPGTRRCPTCCARLPVLEPHAARLPAPTPALPARAGGR